MHASPFEASLDHDFVRTFDHPRTNRPSLLSILRILHHGFSFAQIPHLFTYSFLLEERGGKAGEQAHEVRWTAMFEPMQETRKQIRWHIHACLLQGLKQQIHMFS